MQSKSMDALYIESLRLKNVKLLADQEFDFRGPGGKPRMWTVILGDNGTCKTTILQAVALAASGSSVARALVDDAQDYVCRIGTPRAAEISASFISRNGTPIQPNLTVDRDSHEWESSDVHPGSRMVRTIRSTRDTGFFLAAYGIGRRLARPGEVAVPKDPVRDRVQSLFDTHHKMFGLEWGSALPSPGEFARLVGEAAASPGSDGNALLPGVAGWGRRSDTGRFDNVAMRFGDSAVPMPPHLLSQGYQSILTLLGELVGQIAFEEGRLVDPGNMRGIVLLDEVDLHLHPTWQRRIVPALRERFPHVQFIVTTHSPLVLTGFEQDEIISLDFDDGFVVQEPVRQQPAAQTASELLATFFDVPYASRPGIRDRRNRLLDLSARSGLSEEELLEKARLTQALVPYASVPQPRSQQEADIQSELDGGLEEDLEAEE